MEIPEEDRPRYDAQGGDVKEALTDFPVLVRLHTGNFTFENAKTDGSDIRFVASDDKTPLKYHIERYDPKEEMVLIWVKVPQVAPASAEGFVWLYYGNGSAAAGEDAGGTYDTSQLLVYHLGEKEGPPQDATAYKNNAKEFTGKLGTPSPIGRGITLKGEGDRLVVAKSPSLNFAKGFTFSAWVRSSRAQQDGRLFSWDDGKQSIVIAVDGTKLYASASDGKKKTATDKADLPPPKWVHVAVTAEPGKALVIYTDGRQRTEQKIAALPEPSADIAIGASLSGKNGFAGDLDEVGSRASPARLPGSVPRPWARVRTRPFSPTRTRKARRAAGRASRSTFSWSRPGPSPSTGGSSSAPS